jgi:hypothetical protein
MRRTNKKEDMRFGIRNSSSLALLNILAASSFSESVGRGKPAIFRYIAAPLSSLAVHEKPHIATLMIPKRSSVYSFWLLAPTRIRRRLGPPF